MAAKIKEGMTGGQVADIIEQNFENLENKFQLLSDLFDHTKEDLQRTLDEYQELVDDAYGSLVTKTDEEDTTTDLGKIKFKDRAYDPDNFSGKGYKILRKNIVCDTETKEAKNILTQDMINEANTIYEIRYDFDLNSETITIPEGCTLKFEGGSLSNGDIIGNKTCIQAKIYKIFDSSLNIKGTYHIDNVYVEWFGAVGDGISDDTQYIQKCLDSFEYVNIYFSKTYKVKSIDTTNLGFWYKTNFFIRRNGLKLFGNDNTFIRDEDCSICFLGLGNKTNFLTRNVSYTDNSIFIDDVENYNIGDDILLVGEDGYGEDKAEPREWVFLSITNIDKDSNSIEVDRQIGFNIDINNCNTVGTISTATTNGGIRKISCKDIEFNCFSDLSTYTNKFGSFIYINDCKNINVNNLQVFNQSSVTFKFADNIILNDITKNAFYSSGYRFSVTSIILWECNNVYISNATNIYCGDLIQGRPGSVITMEGSSRSVKVDNIITKMNAKIPDNDYTLSYNSVILSEGCQIDVSNLYIYCISPFRLYAASINDTNTVSKGYCHINNLFISSLEDNTISALNNRDSIDIDNFIYNDVFYGSHIFNKKDNVKLDYTVSSDYTFTFNKGVVIESYSPIKNVTITKISLQCTSSGTFNLSFISDVNNNISVSLNKGIVKTVFTNFVLNDINSYINLKSDIENFDGLVKVTIYYKFNENSEISPTCFLNYGERSNRSYEAPNGFQYYASDYNCPIYKNNNTFYDSIGNVIGSTHVGSNNNLPDAANIVAGFMYYNTENECMLMFDGTAFRDYYGNRNIKLKGLSDQRPDNPNIGTTYYDRTLNKPIWWTGSKWIDATGADI